MLTRLNAPDLRRMKRKGERIVVLTAYDATFARLLDAQVHALLVGDSLGMVIQGHDNTLAVTLEQVVYHTQAVVRGSTRAHVIADMPFMSYQVSVEEGVRNAGRLIKDGGAQAVKIEGGRRHADLIERLTAIGVPVMGHLGLTPQSIHQLGGYKVQGRAETAARELLEDARVLEQAGAYALVLEAVPRGLAKRVTTALRIPTIGIGAGPDCDGQVLVLHDMLGMNREFRPRFVKRYAELETVISRALEDYRREVQTGRFPEAEHSWDGATERKSEGNDDDRAL